MSTDQRLRPDSVVTADEFVAFMHAEVEAEASFTESAGEPSPRTLADYLADLAGRCKRLQDPEDDLWACSTCGGKQTVVSFAPGDTTDNGERGSVIECPDCVPAGDA